MKDGKHPLIQYYCNTNEKNHPLILCIGREQNNKGQIGDHIEPFCFNKNSYEYYYNNTCSFWNVSHGILAFFSSQETRQFKHKVHQKECSPLIYADALKQAIPNEIYNKGKIRNISTVDEFEIQADKIFNNEMINRTRLILLSGLKHKRYDAFNEKVKQLARLNNPQIPVVEIPFFYGTQKSKIIDKINSQPEVVDLINKILLDWLDTP